MKNIEDIYPLSPMQQGMLFHSLYAPESSVYFEQLSCTLRGNLNVQAFEQAWQQVVARYSVLRTAFVWENLSEPLQVVYRQVKVSVETQDWRSLSVKSQQQQLDVFLQSQRQQGFQLSVAPLMRLNLIRLAVDCYQFVWSHHHILLDGWSLPLVFKDLLYFYQAFSRGENLRHEPTVSYRNYIAWLQKQDLAKAEEFWRQKLKGFIAPTPLTVDKLLSNQQQSHVSYSKQQIQFPVQATAAAQSFARQHQLSVNNLVQATWALLLSRYSGETDVVFGATVSGRPPSLVGIESMVGLFINTLPVRVQVSPETELLSLLKDLQALAFEYEQYSYSPLVEIQALSEVPKGTSLFESIVVFENYPLDDTVQQGNGSLEFSNIRVSEQTNYPLTVVADVSGEQLSITMSYDTSRFDDATIIRMLGHFQTLLEGIVANPIGPISQLPLLTEPEQRQLLVEWNDTTVEYPADKCIHSLFEEQAQRTPSAVAVVYENQQLTYDELNCRANQLAHYLRARGVGPEVLVGLCVERSLEMVVGLLGILKAGGAYVPLDPEYPTERLSFMLEDAQVSVLLTQQHLVERLSEYKGQLVCLDTDCQAFTQASEKKFVSDVKPSNLAYILYTSGSTGRPKAVAIEHHSPVALVTWAQQVFTSEQLAGVLASTSICFDLSVFELFVPLCLGGKVILAQNALHLSTLSTAKQVTLVNTVPSAIAELIRVNGIPDGVRTVNLAGESLQNQLVQQIYQQSTIEGVFNLYGPSEDTTYSTFTLIEKGTSSSPAIGRPIANTQVYILDSHLQPVPVGVPGELHIGGAGLARGYLNRPQLTLEKFIANPFNTNGHSRLYKTGDLARYLPSGNIEYLGRIDNQVKIRGFRIELGEIEAVLSQHPSVDSVVVTAIVDTPGDQRLVAYIVPQEHTAPTISDLRQFLKTKLPDYMVPNAFVMLESLPLTPNGKVNRRALPTPELDRCWDKFVAPRTPIEEMLTHIWANVLKVELVGIHDNFFELGGHSLLATQLISHIRSSLKVELPLRSLFAAATVAQMAHLIQQWQLQQLQLTVPPLLPTPRNGHLPLSFAQQRLWFLDQLEPLSAFYNIPGAVGLQGQLQVTALELCLQEIIHRHEALRTNFITVDGQPVQIIHPQTNWTLSVVDWQDLPLSEQEIASQQLAMTQAQQPFDLASEPLFRATLVVLSETEHILLVCMHHIVSDGWSMGVFVQELAALYNAYSQSQPSLRHAKRTPLAPLRVQYADFAVWQRQWLSGEVLQTQLAYWQQQLASSPALLSLPTDRPRPAVQTFSGAHQTFALSVELTHALTQLSQQQGVTLFMTLLAAFDVLLYRYTGTEDILVGSPIANRNLSEIEGLIGFFVNTLVMRTNVSGNPSFSELLGRVRDMAIDAYAHQDLPFEILVEALQPQRSLSHTPLFQVMFVLDNAPMPEVELAGLTVSSLPAQSATAKFDITLSMENTATGLVGVWEYNTDLFDSSTISRMAGHFQTLLEGIVANPIQPISQLPLLTEPEQQQLLVEWNDTQVEYPTDKCIHQLFESQAVSSQPPIGRLIANTQVYILDRHLQPVPIGVLGELYIGGAGLAKGYLNRPELIQEKFIPNPFSQQDSARLYKTGDLARYLPNGTIEYLGSIDNQVKIRGFRIELGEIEAVLGQHPSVHSVIVTAGVDTPGDQRLVAYIVPQQQFAPKISDLLQFLKAKLPDYMVPQAIVMLDALPLTLNGKVDRLALPSPDWTHLEREGTFVAPHTPLEEVVAGIWSEVLGLERVGIHDNFFELGGYSLLATQLIYRVCKAFCVELPLHSLFETPTVAGMCQAINVMGKADTFDAIDAYAVTDLNVEAVLDPSICPKTLPVEYVTEPNCILLTGATGFLGAFLLHELLEQTQADIYCLVRSSNAKEAKNKIENNLKSYLLWNEYFSSRIIPIVGDLSQPLLGLSFEQFQIMASKIDIIYHNGALVNFIYPYSALKATNVLGTEEILKLATQIKVKPVHFISTVSVFSSNSYSQDPVILEQDNLNCSEGVDFGYPQSKWVAEKLVMIARSRGLPVCIYRPGRISGHSQTGACQTDDFLWRIIKGCIQLGSIPDLDIMVDLTPVEYVSKAIVHLSRQPESLTKAFHLVNPHSIHFSKLIEWMKSFGYQLEQISYEKWRAKLINVADRSSENAVYSLVPLFYGTRSEQQMSDQTKKPQFDCQNTLNGLAGTSIICSPINAELLSTYFSYFIRSGYLSAPFPMTELG